MMKVTKTIFVLGILLLSITLSDDVLSAESSVKEVILKVGGMTCASCPAMIKTALKKLDGIVSADVSFKEAKATVKYQEEKITVEQMIKVIEGIGMKASPFAKGE